MARPSDEPQPSLLDYFYIEAAEDDSTLSFDNWNASYNLSSSFDRISWTALTSNVIATGVNTGTKVYLAGNTTTLGTSYAGQGAHPNSDKKFKLGGKILSLYSDLLEPKVFSNSYDLKYWEQQNSNLVEISIDFEGAPLSSAQNMFWECFSLSSVTTKINLEVGGSGGGNYVLLFNKAPITSLPPGSTFKAINGEPVSCRYMFSKCGNLKLLPDKFECPDIGNAGGMFQNCGSLTTIGNNVKIGNNPSATSTDDSGMPYGQITTIGDNFEWFTNVTFSGTWDPALGIKNVFPNATSVGSGWKVYDHYDGE